MVLLVFNKDSALEFMLSDTRHEINIVTCQKICLDKLKPWTRDKHLRYC